MKFRGTKLSRRTLALLAAAVIMLGGSGAMGTKAALTVFGPNYDATIATNTLGVELTEAVNGGTKATIPDNGSFTLTKDATLAVGKPYKDTIGVSNSGTAAEYVRVIVRKYWTDKNGKKTTTLDPELIKLKLAGGWIEKNGGSAETKIYYLKRQLTTGNDGKNATLFENVVISGDVLKDGVGKTVDSKTEDGATKTVITYTYEYDGYTFNVEAEAQSVQTHHAADAMKSVWGVNATVSGDSITAVN